VNSAAESVHGCYESKRLAGLRPRRVGIAPTGLAGSSVPTEGLRPGLPPVAATAALCACAARTLVWWRCLGFVVLAATCCARHCGGSEVVRHRCGPAGSSQLRLCGYSLPRRL